MIKKIFNFIKKIIMMPFELLKKLFKRTKKTRIEELKEYLIIAKKNNLKIDVQVNYNNDLIINMSNFAIESKRVRKKEK